MIVNPTCWRRWFWGRGYSPSGAARKWRQTTPSHTSTFASQKQNCIYGFYIGMLSLCSVKPTSVPPILPLLGTPRWYRRGNAVSTCRSTMFRWRVCQLFQMPNSITSPSQNRHRLHLTVIVRALNSDDRVLLPLLQLQNNSAWFMAFYVEHATLGAH